MAGDWIKMRTDLRDAPKVVRIAHHCRDAASVTGVTLRLLVVGALHALWSLADAHSTDGALPGYGSDEVDSLVGLPGFASALVEVGWLKIGPAGAAIADFDAHNGATGKARAQSRNRMKAKRLRDARGVTESSPEKRREEKRDTNLASLGSRGAADAARGSAPDESAPLADLPRSRSEAAAARSDPETASETTNGEVPATALPGPLERKRRKKAPPTTEKRTSEAQKRVAECIDALLTHPRLDQHPVVHRTWAPMMRALAANGRRLLPEQALAWLQLAEEDPDAAGEQLELAYASGSPLPGWQMRRRQNGAPTALDRLRAMGFDTQPLAALPPREPEISL